MSESDKQAENKRGADGRFVDGNKESPGRPKGSKNKFTNLKAAFLEAFEELGGAEGLWEWAEKNQANKRAFYQMITKMLPASLVGEIDIKELPLVKFTQVKDKDDIK